MVSTLLDTCFRKILEHSYWPIFEDRQRGPRIDDDDVDSRREWGHSYLVVLVVQGAAVVVVELAVLVYW
jgi:hypothetical protein